ncbi:hypothetical protein A374_16548 [Fictibacillus macauensis ZFHKF-1]|uniref:Uncharacterized protein n=1 Tax=Fictibacillus macauensis ZFHKF-1 TaxID=1196324 RepID=I8IXL6_9BACL|nr:hypothetical protein [Fictibacillus macauensis]EIT84231.1 hypothetical protein A374_16548 [Fictibacillus macauensis ZFHKF-1]
MKNSEGAKTERRDRVKYLRSLWAMTEMDYDLEEEDTYENVLSWDVRFPHDHQDDRIFKNICKDLSGDIVTYHISKEELDKLA